MEEVHQTITVVFEFSGVHHWKDAPPQVAFLRTPHRHRFLCAATVAVQHDNRDVEFFILKDKLESFPRVAYKPYHKDLKNTRELGSRSCEMIAKEIFDFLAREGFMPMDVTVSEDGENGGSYSRTLPE